MVKVLTDEYKADKDVKEGTIPKKGKLKTDGYYMDGYLKGNLDALKRNVKRDYDAFIVMTGREGYGKSTLAAQVAKYLDPTFGLDRCCFSITQFIEAVEKADRYQAIVFDEAMGYLSSRGAMSKFNKKLVKIMSEMRSKNLFVIICIPNFFELDRYPAMHRSTGLIHCHRRSFFVSYDYPTKLRLYLKGKKDYSYSVSPNFRGRFHSFFIYDKEAYEKKKQKAIFEFEEELVDSKIKKQRNCCFHILKNKFELKTTELRDLINNLGVDIGISTINQGTQDVKRYSNQNRDI